MAEATNAAHNAYVPYSEFAVGAVAVTTDRTRFRGANVENAAFGSTLCAEAVAIASAVAAGHAQVETVAVASGAGETCYPCGNCRQIMSEFGVQRLVVRDEGGTVRTVALSDLLPSAFGSVLRDDG